MPIDTGLALGATPRALVACANPDLRAALSRVFELAQCQSSTCADSTTFETALASMWLVPSTRSHLIIAELELPGGSPLDILEAVRTSGMALPPFAFVGRTPGGDDVARAWYLGAAGLLRAPAHPRVLAPLVESMLDRSAGQSDRRGSGHRSEQEPRG